MLSSLCFVLHEQFCLSTRKGEHVQKSFEVEDKIKCDVNGEPSDFYLHLYIKLIVSQCAVIKIILYFIGVVWCMDLYSLLVLPERRYFLQI